MAANLGEPGPTPGTRLDHGSVRAAAEALCEPLAVEDCVVRSAPEVSPTNWRLAHTTWLFETFGRGPHVPDHRVFDPGYAHLFSSGHDTVGR